MKVLFVYSGNKEAGISPIVKSQMLSLIKEGVDISEFAIKGKGLSGYLKNIAKLREFTNEKSFDIVHAHYSLTGIVASLAGCKTIVVSLMGSDVNESRILNRVNQIFGKYFWNFCIVKSEGMKQKFGLSDTYVIPNGVNLETFEPIAKKQARQELNWSQSETKIIFVSNPSRKEKNYKLLKDAVDNIDSKSEADISIEIVSGVKQNLLKFYYSAADVIALPSLWEGSPNVIKEAMACNCPIVTTDVGDTRWVTKGVEGCFVAKDFTAKTFAEILISATEFANSFDRTEGRKRIIELGLDSKTTAKKIISVYNKILTKA